MQNNSRRPNGRLNDQIRPLKVSYNVFGYATSSILFEIGNTKVLCAVNLQSGVPPFLKGSNSGWLNAEYAMLPTATATRTQRESTANKANGRSVEISRLIGRTLRSIVDLSALGERTITVDCDVLQADGGTRTACITAACVALRHAATQWLATKQIPRHILNDEIAAISAGISNGIPILDPDYAEDSTIDSDFNFILTKSGALIEVQGTAEKSPVSWEHFDQLRAMALKGTAQLFTFFAHNQAPAVAPHSLPEQNAKNNGAKSARDTQQKNSLFSLANRLQAVQKPSE